MLSNTKESIQDFLTRFCMVKSVTDTPGELEAPVFLYEEFSKLSYYQTNPKDFFIQEIKGDRLGRSNFVAWVKAAKETKKTVILMGHFDVVDTDVCGDLREVAFNGPEYTKRIAEEVLSEDARRDLESGDWMFGRGMCDMKSGLSAQAVVMAEYAANPDALDVNLLYLAVADEENNACGIHECIHYLNELKAEGYEFLCCVDSEPTISQLDKKAAWIHLGTVGMYTPFAFVLGCETHVGEYFEGISAAAISFELGGRLEGSGEFADRYRGVTYPPMTCLKMYDLKPTYSVTLIERIAMYYNVLFVTKTPGEVLDHMTAAAQAALDAAILSNEEKRVAQESFTVAKNFKGEVVRFEQLVEWAEAKSGRSFKAISQEFLATLPKETELQDRGLKLVNHFIDIAGVKGPKIVIGFLPPYCPALYNDRQTDDELRILRGAEAVMAHAKSEFGQEMRIAEVYEGISDLSELGFKGTDEDIQHLEKNWPGWGVDFEYPFSVSKALDIPVVNIGPIGKDAHKKTERLYLPYALEHLPELLKVFIEEMSQE